MQTLLESLALAEHAGRVAQINQAARGIVIARRRSARDILIDLAPVRVLVYVNVLQMTLAHQALLFTLFTFLCLLAFTLFSLQANPDLLAFSQQAGERDALARWRGRAGLAPAQFA